MDATTGPGPASDAALRTAWEHACTVDRRPQLLRMALVLAAGVPVFAALLSWARAELLSRFFGVGLVVEVALLVHIALLARARTPRRMLVAHWWNHLTLVAALTYLAVRADLLDVHAVGLSMFIWAPLAGYTLSRAATLGTFFVVPAAFLGSWLLHPVQHPVEVVARTVFILCLSATIGYVLMEHKRKVEWAAFRSRHDLDRANQELAASMRRLVRTQGELVRSEKLAVLGQLVAGVAPHHKTPHRAKKAAAGPQTRGLPASVLDLPGALAEMDEIERALFLALLERAMAAPTGAAAVSSRDERSTRRRLARTLSAVGIEDAQRHAEVLSELGANDDLDSLLPLLQHPGAGAVLARVDAIAALRRSAGTIELAAVRASRIVQALKRYAHPGDAGGNAVRASLADNIDTVLTLYGSHLKRGVEVVREYGDRGHVEARHEALNQVWTNLVHNALQAMDGQGQLTVRVRSDGDDAVRVEVEDDGPGIPPDVRARIFEPFFTTKGAGEGSGLGLGICQDIVQRHGGRIEVASRPGCTRFSVTLPRSATA